jgi:hypothetical protein
LVEQRLECGERLLRRDGDLGQGEVLAHEAARGLVVLDREPRAREAKVFWRQVQPRDRQRDIVLDAKNGRSYGSDRRLLRLGRAKKRRP